MPDEEARAEEGGDGGRATRGTVERRRLGAERLLPSRGGVGGGLRKTRAADVMWAPDPRGRNTKRLGWIFQSSLQRTAAAYSPTWWGSTIGDGGLNFSVRNGKRWYPAAIATAVCYLREITHAALLSEYAFFR